MHDYIEKLEMLPNYMRGGMQRYIEDGIVPGDFLSRFLCNDLMGALGAADDTNLNMAQTYAVYLYNYAPAGCYGSSERFDAWVKKGGLLGSVEVAA